MFWDLFVSCCNEKNQAPNKVCSELGLSNATATQWKKGATPRDTTIRKIADHFGVSVDYLLGKEKTPTTISRDERSDDFARLFSSLSEEQQKLIILQMRGILSERE